VCCYVSSGRARRTCGLIIIRWAYGVQCKCEVEGKRKKGTADKFESRKGDSCGEVVKRDEAKSGSLAAGDNLETTTLGFFSFLAVPDSAGTRVQDWRPRDVSCLRALSCMLHEAGGTDIEEVGCKCGPQLLHQWSVWGSAGQGCLVGFSGVQHV
jgi:hypothetical protein